MIATLKAAIGPKARVIGASAVEGSSQEVLASMLAPPCPEKIAVVKKGSWPCSTAHGVHSRNQRA